jgi:hypothetical protein
VTAAPWPYKVSADTIAAALRAVSALRAVGRDQDAEDSLWRLRKRVGQDAIDAVRPTPLVADQRCLFDAEMCQCCGTEPVGDRDGVRCGRCSGRRHRVPCGGGEAA